MAFLVMSSEVGSAEWLVPLIERLKADGEDVRLIGALPAVDVWRRAGLMLHAEVSQASALETVWRTCADGVSLLISSATGSPVETSAVDLAKQNGIPVIAFLDAFSPSRPRLMPAGSMLDYDLVLLIDEMQKQEIIAEGVPVSCLRVVGQPAWERAGLLPQADERRVLFLGQPIRKYYGTALPFDECSAWSMLQSVCEARPELRFETIYAVHPEEDSSNLPVLPQKIAQTSTREAILNCGTVVGMFSSLLVPALVGRRRVISLQPHARHQDYCGLSRRRLIPRAVDEVDLERLLTSEEMPEPGNRWQGSMHAIMEAIAQL